MVSRAVSITGINMTTKIPVSVGDKIKFYGESQRYTVRACNGQFAVCTKPFNLKRTVIYTIIDFGQGIRGTENLIFCMGFETDEDCAKALERLISGDTEVSSRNQTPLRIESVKSK
jgi:hypothetical protein